MKIHKLYIVILVLLVSGLFLFYLRNQYSSQKQFASESEIPQHWFLLHRKSNQEELYKGVPGDRANSVMVRTFQVKTGIPGERPTPLPQLFGREYWLLTEKHPELDSPETAPYFITLDVPAPNESPYGPVPYTECKGQCDWVKPGAFGLHGINGDESRLSAENPGSSGCIRHTDEDITYLYNLLNPTDEEIRYYIEDN